MNFDLEISLPKDVFLVDFDKLLYTLIITTINTDPNFYHQSEYLLTRFK